MVTRFLSLTAFLLLSFAPRNAVAQPVPPVFHPDEPLPNLARIVQTDCDTFLSNYLVANADTIQKHMSLPLSPNELFCFLQNLSLRQSELNTGKYNLCIAAVSSTNFCRFSNGDLYFGTGSNSVYTDFDNARSVLEEYRICRAVPQNLCLGSPMESPEAIDNIIAELNDESFEVREQAQAGLIAHCTMTDQTLDILNTVQARLYVEPDAERRARLILIEKACRTEFNTRCAARVTQASEVVGIGNTSRQSSSALSSVSAEAPNSPVGNVSSSSVSSSADSSALMSSSE